MKQRLQSVFTDAQPTFDWRVILRSIAFLVIATFIFVIILANRSPNFLRPASISTRTGFTITLAVFLVALYLSFRWKGWLGQLLSLVFTLALFAFPLAGLWAVGQTQPTVFNGIVPLFDASDYYSDALRLLAGQDFSVFSARRPLFGGLLAVMLWLANYNLMTALGILTLLTGLSCYAATKEIQRTHGVEVAVVVLTILFLYYRYHSGLTMSENLGLPLGALGFALLWRGSADRNKFLVWMGLLVITLALNARAGAFFMLPVLLIWFGWLFRESKKFSWSFFAVGGSAVILGFIVNLVMFRLLATSSGVPFANFSYTLYGLASGGKSWIYVFETHPELYQLQEPYQSREVYRLAFDLILQQPNLILMGAFHNWSMLFSNSWYGAYSYVVEQNGVIGWITQSGLFLLCGLGILRWIRNPDDALNGLVVVAAAGIFLSVPFLPPTDAYRMRPYAVSIVIFGLLPAMGLLFGMEKLRPLSPKHEFLGNSYIPAISVLATLLVFASTIGALLIKTVGKLPVFQPATCEAANMDLLSVRFDPGTHFNVIRQKAPGLDWMPNFHVGRFRSNSHSLPQAYAISWTDTVEPGESIISSLDFQSMQKVMIVTSTDRLPAVGALWQVCGEWETDPGLDLYKIFYVRSEPVLINE